MSTGATPKLAVVSALYNEQTTAQLKELDERIAKLDGDYIKTRESYENRQAEVITAARRGEAPKDIAAAGGGGTTAIPPPITTEVPLALRSFDSIGVATIPTTWKASRLIGGRAAPDAQTIHTVALNFQRETKKELNNLALGALTAELKALKERAQQIVAAHDASKKILKEMEDAAAKKLTEFVEKIKVLSDVTSARAGAASPIFQRLSMQMGSAWTGSNSGQNFAQALDNIALALSSASAELDLLLRGAAQSSLPSPPLPPLVPPSSNDLVLAQARIATLEGELQQARNAANAASAVSDQLKHQATRITEMEARINELEKELGTRAKRISQLEKDLEECQNAGADKDAELSAARDKEAGFLRELKERKDAIATLELQKKSLEDDLRKIPPAAPEDDPKKRVRTTDPSLSVGLEQQNQALAKQVQELTQRLNDLKSNADAALAEEKAKQTRIEADLSLEKSKLTTLRESHGKQAEQISKLNAQLKTTDEQHAQAAFALQRQFVLSQLLYAMVRRLPKVDVDTFVAPYLNRGNATLDRDYANLVARVRAAGEDATMREALENELREASLSPDKRIEAPPLPPPLPPVIAPSPPVIKPAPAPAPTQPPKQDTGSSSDSGGKPKRKQPDGPGQKRAPSKQGNKSKEDVVVTTKMESKLPQGTTERAEEEEAPEVAASEDDKTDIGDKTANK